MKKLFIAVLTVQAFSCNLKAKTINNANHEIKYTTVLRHNPLLDSNKLKNKPRGNKKILKWHIGQSPFQPAPDIINAFKENSYHTEYELSPGIYKLRKAISNYFKNRFTNIALNPDLILITSGSTSALGLLTKFLDGPIFLPYASYFGFMPLIEAADKKINWIPTQSKNSYKLQSKELEKAVSKYERNSQKILIINNPNNPTGATYSREEIKKLAQICEQYNVFVIYDIIYAQTKYFDNTRFASFSEFIPHKTFITSGISKVFHAPGWRLGFFAIPDFLETNRQINQAQKLFFNNISTTYLALSGGVNVPSQYAASTAFSFNNAIKEYTETSYLIQKAACEYLYSLLKKLNLKLIKPNGAFYLFPDFSPYKETLSKKFNIKTSNDLANYLKQELSILTLPGSRFGLPKDILALRISATDYNSQKALKGARTHNSLLRNNPLKFAQIFLNDLNIGFKRLENFIRAIKNNKKM